MEDNRNTELERLFQAAREEPGRIRLEELMQSVKHYQSAQGPSFFNNLSIRNIMIITGVLLTGLATIMTLTDNTTPEPQYLSRITLDETIQALEGNLEDQENSVAYPTEQTELMKHRSEMVTPSIAPGPVNLVDTVRQEDDIDDRIEEGTTQEGQEPRVAIPTYFGNSSGRPIMPRRIADAKEKDHVLYFINENTTESELTTIQRRAAESGVQFDFKMRGRGEKRQMRKMEASIKDHFQWNISMSGAFEIKFGWYEDEHGQATHFYEGVIDMLERLCTGEDLELSLAQSRELDEFIDHWEEEEDSLMQVLKFDIEALQEELHKLESEMAEEGQELYERFVEDAEFLLDSESYEKVLFHIDHETDEDELDRLKAQAKAKGADFEYDHKGRSKFFSISLVRPDGRTATQRTELDTDGAFKVVLGIGLNGEGKAIRLLTESELRRLSAED